MNTKKIIAILLIILMFEIFFEVGLFFMFEPAEQIDPTVIYVDKPYPVYVTDVVPQSVSVFGIGVHEDNNTGEIVEVNVSMVPGRGRIYFDTTYHSFGGALQDSIPMIKDYVEIHTGQAMNSKDVTITMYATAHGIEGTSGGAAIGAGIIALIENKSLDIKTAITGTLDEIGRVGTVAALKTKVKVAADLGLERIIVPEEQCDDVNGEEISIEVVCVATMDELLAEITV